jgi:hypothetical protein
VMGRGGIGQDCHDMLCCWAEGYSGLPGLCAV